MRKGPVSRLAPAARLLSFVALMPGLFVAGEPLVLLILAATLAGLLDEGLPLGSFLAELPAFLFLLAFLVLVQSLRFSGGPLIAAAAAFDALRYGLRLLAAFALGRLFYRSTPSSELREAAMSLGRFLPGNLGRDVGLALSLVLGFIPGIILEWRLSLEAGKARGVRNRSSFFLRLRVMEAFLRRLILSALAIPEILAARGWTGGAVRGRRWNGQSWLALLGCAGFSLAILLQPSLR